LAPLLIQVSTGLSIKLFSKWKSKESTSSENKDPKLKDHVVVVGYGVGGRTLAQVLLEAKIPFVVLELDGERIRRALTEGITTLYGDCAQEQTLIRAGLRDARMIVLKISDYAVTEKTVRLSRKINPQAIIMVRTRRIDQVEELKNAGADQVIPEEFETSIEIFSRVLRDYHIPNNIIEQQVELIRLEGYSMFRGLALNTESLKKFSTYLTATLTESYLVLEESWACGKTVGDINIPAKTGAVVIAVVSKNKPHANPDQKLLVQSGDTFILLGSHIQLDQSLKMLRYGHSGGGEKSNLT